MDNSKSINNCRTCLGTLGIAKNLCFLKYNKLLELLNRILGFKINIEDGVFNICQSCESSLSWILEFKIICEKSLKSIEKSNVFKKGFAKDNEELDWIKSEALENTNNEVDPQNINSKLSESNFASLPDLTNDSDTDDLESTDVKEIQRCKKRKGSLNKSINKSPNNNVKLRRTKYKQYAAEMIRQAIAESSNYITDIKTRSCTSCTYQGGTSTVLSCHMYKHHPELIKSWCNRCNLQTRDLEAHKNDTLCSENRCKLCNKKCKSTNSLATHLKLHCHAYFKEPSNDNKKAETAENESATTIWFKEDPFTENSHIVNSIKEEIKIDNEKLSWRVRKLIKSSISTIPENESVPGNSDKNGAVSKSYRLEQFSRQEVEKALKDTMRSYHMNRICIICGKDAYNSAALSSHMGKLHKASKSNWCNKCNKMIENLEEHLDTHKMECVFCKRVFNSFTHFKNHIKAHCVSFGNLDSAWHSCKRCQNSYPTKAEFKNHKCDSGSASKRKFSKNASSENSNDDDSSADEEVCGKIKTRYKQFSADAVQEAIDDTRKVVKESRNCIVCGHLAMRSLTIHMRRAHMNLLNKWCRFCNTFPENFTEHINNHENDLKCRFCDKTYKKSFELRMHLKCHSKSANLNTEIKWFPCTKCKKSYTSLTLLNEHIRESLCAENAGNIIQLKPCKICHTPVSNLRLHMKQNHRPKRGPNQRLCPFCGKVYLRNYDLTVHVRTHTGEKPFKCSHCEKQFNIKRSLEVHERRHLGVKRHVCYICAKAFVTVVELQSHAKIHDTTVVSERCEICDRTFSRRGVLKTHIYKNHRGKGLLQKSQKPTCSKIVETEDNNETSLKDESKPQPTEAFHMFFDDIC